VIALLLAAALATAQDAAAPRAIVFAPPSGARVERTIVVEHDLRVTSMSAIQNGQVRTLPTEMRVATRQTLELTDELRRVEGGRPVLLQRRFGPATYHLELTTGNVPKPQTVRDVKSPLESASVLFTWVPEERGWGRYYDAEEALEEFLAGLDQDLDLLPLLPKTPVAPGATWRVGAAELRSLFAPCGKLPMDWPADLERPLVRTLSSGVAGGLSEVFGGGAEGGATVTFARVAGSGDDEVLVLVLDVDVTLERDQLERERDRETLEEEAPPAGAIHRAHVKWAFRGTGEVEWSARAARLARMRLAGDETVTSRLSLDKDGHVQNELALQGRLSITGTVTAKP
jgi:hypothetical protein